MAAKAKMVLAMVVAVIVGMVFFVPAQTAVTDNTGSQDVTNETVSANVGSYVDLGGYDIDSGSETVYAYNDTGGYYETASSGTDYEMAYSNGSIKALSSSTHIDDGEDVKVSYTYQASNSATTTVVGFIPVMLGTLIFFVIANGVRKELK